MINRRNLLRAGMLLNLAVVLAISSCKKETAFSPSIPEGTRFPKINLKGFTLERMQVHIGPRSVIAGYVEENISAVAYEVPFVSEQNLNRVVFYKADGSAPYATSQINFKTPAKDTTVTIFYDGKTFFQNPTFPVAASGKMLFRAVFQSTASTYKGPVDLEFHEGISEVIKLDKGKKTERDTTIITIKTPIARKISNVKQTEFTDYIEMPAFYNLNENITSYYVIYVRLPGTTNLLPYPTNNVVADPYAVFYTTPDYTGIITIKDNRINVEKPNRIEYKVEDRMIAFL